MPKVMEPNSQIHTRDDEPLNGPRQRMEVNAIGRSVPGEGFEPSRGHPRRILSAVRLPFRHPGWWDSAKFTLLNLPQSVGIARACGAPGANWLSD